VIPPGRPGQVGRRGDIVEAETRRGGRDEEIVARRRTRSGSRKEEGGTRRRKRRNRTARKPIPRSPRGRQRRGAQMNRRPSLATLIPSFSLSAVGPGEPARKASLAASAMMSGLIRRSCPGLMIGEVGPFRAERRRDARDEARLGTGGISAWPEELLSAQIFTPQMIDPSALKVNRDDPSGGRGGPRGSSPFAAAILNAAPVPEPTWTSPSRCQLNCRFMLTPRYPSVPSSAASWPCVRIVSFLKGFPRRSLFNGRVEDEDVVDGEEDDDQAKRAALPRTRDTTA